MVTSDKELWRQEVDLMKERGMSHGRIVSILGHDDGFLEVHGLPYESLPWNEIGEYVMGTRSSFSVSHQYPKSDFCFAHLRRNTGL